MGGDERGDGGVNIVSLYSVDSGRRKSGRREEERGGEGKEGRQRKREGLGGGLGRRVRSK